MTATDSLGNEYADQRVYHQIGLDTDRRWRYGAWQIKEVLDMTLQPTEVRSERVVFVFPKNTASADVNVDVTYFISGAKGEKVFSTSKHIDFKK